MLGFQRSSASYCLERRSLRPPADQQEPTRPECQIQRQRWDNLSLFVPLEAWELFPIINSCCHQVLSIFFSQQDSQETTPVDKDSDLDEEAALAFYRNIEEQLRLKRKSKSEDAEE